jgi:hypothetical protein
MFDETLCRYTANNFNTVMAKNAKLTIIEVRSVKRGLMFDLIGPLISGREYRSRWLDLPKRYSSTWHLCRSHCASYNREACGNSDPCSTRVRKSGRKWACRHGYPSPDRAACGKGTQERFPREPRYRHADSRPGTPPTRCKSVAAERKWDLGNGSVSNREATRCVRTSPKIVSACVDYICSGTLSTQGKRLSHCRLEHLYLVSAGLVIVEFVEGNNSQIPASRLR